MTDEKKKAKPRAGIRFTLEGNEYGHISYNSEAYSADTAVFVINESMHGACLVINRKLVPSTITFAQGMYIMVKIGKLDPVTAIVRWVRMMDEDIIKIGVEYTEKRHAIKFE